MNECITNSRNSIYMSFWKSGLLFELLPGSFLPRTPPREYLFVGRCPTPRGFLDFARFASFGGLAPRPRVSGFARFVFFGVGLHAGDLGLRPVRFFWGGALRFGVVGEVALGDGLVVGGDGVGLFDVRPAERVGKNSSGEAGGCKACVR